MLVIFGFLLTIFLGLLLTLVIVPKMHPLERLGVSYVLGLGLLTLFMFFYALIGFSFTRFNTIAALLIPILILFPLEIKKVKTYFDELTSLNYLKLSEIERLIVLIISFLFLYSLISNLYWPVTAWDALTLYDRRAKIFFDTGFMEEAIKRGSFFDYPLLTSLAHTFVYLFGGNNPQFIYSLFLIAFAFMFYGAVRVFSSRALGIFAVFFLVTIPSILTHSTIAYTNLPYAIYFGMGTIYLYTWMVKKQRGHLLLAALLAGLSTWTRSKEPFWLVNLAILLIYSLYKKEYLAPFIFAMIFFSIQQPWKIFQTTVARAPEFSTAKEIELSLLILLTKPDIQKLWEVLIYINRYVIDFLQPILSLFLLVLVLEFKNLIKKNNLLFLGLVFANFSWVVIGIYIFSSAYPFWEQIPGSAARMCMFFFPLFTFYIFTSETIKKFISRVQPRR